jgi:hypothetical protein
MFLMFSLAYLFFLACKLARTSRTSKHWVANSFNICLNFKASNWAQFSSDLQNSNSFEKLRSSSIISAKKKFFLSRAHATYKRCIYIYLLAMHLQDNLKSFCIFCLLGRNRKNPEPNRTEPALCRFQPGKDPTQQNPNRNRTEPTHSEAYHYFCDRFIINTRLSQSSVLWRFTSRDIFFVRIIHTN